MEIQDSKKATTHDFLSLYKETSGFTQIDPTLSPQEIHRKKTQDFLQPFEEKRTVVTPATFKQLSTVKLEPSEVQGTGGAFVLWGGEESVPARIITGARRHQQQQKQKQWSSSSSPSPPCTAPSIRNSSLGSILSGRKSTGQERRSMDTGSKSGKGFTDEDEDDEVVGRREASSQKDLTVKIDRKTHQNNNDQEATTPRSKHSATEQRRRSKINDRFQILRDLIPHSDQKRDKASFLLEVIEYIQFLKEKVEKSESGYPVWNQETIKMIPWKNNQVPTEIIAEPSHALRNGPSPPKLVISGDNIIPAIPVPLANNHAQLESENLNSGLAHKVASLPPPLQQYGRSKGFINLPHQRFIPESENVASQSQSRRLRQTSGYATEILSEHDLMIDEGTISISSAYSQGILNALTEALKNTGLDLSQASVSVNINLGKRAFNKPVINQKDPSVGNETFGHSSHMVSSTIEETEHANSNKRHKPGTSHC